MADSEVVFTGIAQTTRMLDEGTKFALRALAIIGATQAKRLQKPDTGQLRNSIQWVIANGQRGGLNDSGSDSSAEGKLSTPLKGSAFVGATADYAVYQEFGTRYIAPRPFLRPSLALLAGDTQKVVKDKMDAEFKLGPLKYGQERIKF
jgi:HK97 gp10 family phage protein